MQTGLLLVIGTIVAGIGWMAIYPAAEGGAAAQAKAILADPGAAKIGITMGYGGMIIAFLGLINITRSMAAAGGAGAAYANISVVLFTALVAGFILGFGLEYGSADVPAAAAAFAGTLQGIAEAAGGAMQLTFSIALILLGAGIFLDKNYHVITAALAIVAGVSLLFASFASGGAENAVGTVGWIAFLVMGLVLGGLTLKSDS